MTRRRWLQFDLALVAVFCWLALGCGALWDRLLGPLKEGAHRIQAVTAADIARGVTVRTCLQGWARANGYPGAEYSDVDIAARLVIVRVGGDGVIGTEGTSSWQTPARENGDTLFVSEGVPNSLFVAVEYHELVHVVQEHHRELIGANGDIHWSPPWDFCHIRRSIVI